MSIADTFGRKIRDLRVSVTDRCNFRCPYCMPADIYGEKYTFLPRKEILSFEEVARLVQVFTRFGVKKLRLTGGEPLMREDFSSLVRLLSGTAGIEDIALTTNGYFLPKSARPLRDAGLHRITVSLDSLDEEVFKRMNGRDYSVDRVLQGIEAAEKAGFGQLKINAVVQRGVNDHTILDLVRRFRGTGHIVRFIEFMDVGNLNGWDRRHVVTADEILSCIGTEYPLEPVEANYDGEVVNRFRFKDGQGEIGVIASVTNPFCGGCTRIRLSTEGRLFTCLFATEGTDIREPLRSGASDDEIFNIIAGVWKKRDDRYSELRSQNSPQDMENSSPKKIEMYQIGG
jgi:cyclic pyranopterin phosphate synthase